MRKEEIEITIRPAEVKDAKRILDFYKQIGEETDFMHFGPEGVLLNQEQEQRYLKQVAESPNNLVLIAEMDKELIGLATLGAPASPKIAHIAELGICILKKYWGFGISRILMQDLLDWAIDSEVLDFVQLTVHEDNIRAIKLYKHFGFEEEAVLPYRIKLEDGYKNQLVMLKDVRN